MTAAISLHDQSADAVSLLAELDACVSDRLLVFGSLPPDGRDLDLLVRPAERSAVSTRLVSLGFERHEHQWVRFRNGQTAVVDLVPVEAWYLPREEVLALFDDGTPFSGMRAIVRPAPAHAVLILSKKVVRRGGKLYPKVRAQIESILVEDGEVWQRAGERAARWGAETALKCLFAAYSDAESVSIFARSRALAEISRASGRDPVRAYVRAWASLVPRPRSGNLVTFSGLDGAGKSSQAAALQRALHMLGHHAVVEWSPLGGTRSAAAVVAFGRPLLRRALGSTRLDRPPRLGIGHIEDDETREPTRFEALLRGVWVAVLAGLNAAAHLRAAVRHLGRGRTVIFDRYVLDSAVQLQHNYGDTRLVRFLIRLLKRLSPTATSAYLLDVRPEIALERKVDLWNVGQLRRRAELYRELHDRLGVLRVDAEQSPEVVADQIARDVWRRLGKG